MQHTAVNIGAGDHQGRPRFTIRKNMCIILFYFSVIMGPVNAPGDTAFPSEFDSLSVNECTIKGNISDHSSMKAMKMVKQGKNNIIEGPSYKQRQLC